MYRTIILSHLFDYLNLKGIKVKKALKVFDCPFCGQKTAIVIPNAHTINCHTCKPKVKLGRFYNLIDVARKLDFGEKQPEKDEEILQHLKDILKIKVMTKTDENNIEKYLDYYVKNEFDLVPCAVICPFCKGKGYMKDKKKCKKCKGTGNYGKNPIENEWTTKNHKDKNEWQNWIANGLNIGIKTGDKSNITVIDVDQKPIPEAIKKLMGNTLMQETPKGYHLFYKYDKDFPKTRIDEYKIDIENDLGQVIIYPSKTNNIQRKIKNLVPIIQIPKEFKELLMSKITVPRQTHSENIREAIKTEDFKIDPTKFTLKNNQLEGSCNTEFIKLGGILRKQLNSNQTGYVLNVLNKHMLENPMQPRAIQSMIRELDKYSSFDEKELAHQVLEHLKETDEMSRNEMAMTIVGTNRGEDKKRIDKALQYLVKEGYIRKRGAKYIIKKKANWKTSLINVGIPIDFKMPYFDDVMNFNWGDLILIGSGNARGKTHISMNIIKQLVEQGLEPYYLSLESGSRFIKIAQQLGMVEPQLKYDEVADATGIELESNKAITIIDWVCPNSYAEVDKLLMHFTKQLQKTKGIAIIFMQLRDNNEWLAKDLVKQFPSFACRYIYDNTDSGEYGRFEIDKAREPKIKAYNKQLPCLYNWETKELKLITGNEENEANKKDKN